MLAQLESDHDRLDACWRHLRPLLAGIAAGQRANLSPGAVHELQALYASHLGLENGQLLPLCEQALTREELDAIGREMAARRGVRWEPPARERR
jgi:hemerythrin-like domain-containing protein